ncbi:hypothetical protein BASA62_003391 [Batrachochytrium salamandrivorans]|nr:hypothetical protein BASA62_003391 [Batrachochytrium salamandrivorans]
MTNSKLRIKLAKLKAAYEKEMEIQKSFKVEDFVMAEQRVVSLRSKMRYFKLALKEDGIGEAEKSARIEQYVDATKKWKKAYATMIAKNNEFKKARENRDNAHIELLIMKQHHERIAKHNVNNQDKIELSSCSYYSLEILKVQSDDVCRNAKDLAISKKGVTYDIYKLGRAIHKADGSEKDKLVQTLHKWRSRYEPAVGWTGTVEHESMGTRHDNRALAARLADFLQVAYRAVSIHIVENTTGDRIVEVG